MVLYYDVENAHIINYAKTRDTYVAYRKSGYNKKYLIPNGELNDVGRR